MKNVVLFMLVFCSVAFGAKSHTTASGSEIHTPFRWVWADSAARVAQSTVKADTTKLGFQKSDFSVWYLHDSLPTWYRVGTYKSDSLRIGGILIKNDNITGVDSTYSTAIEGLRLRYPTAWIDSIVGDIKIRGTLRIVDSTHGFGRLRIVPYTDGLEAIMSFFSDVAGTTTSNAWAIGQGGWSAPSAFVIGRGANRFIKIDTLGVTHLDSGIVLGGGSTLDTYTESFFACTLSASYVTVAQIDTIHYTKIGKVVTLLIPPLSGTSNSNNMVLKFAGRPDDIAPSNGVVYKNAIVTDNGNKRSGYMLLNSIASQITLSISDATTDVYSTTGFTSSGTKGTNRMSFEYTLH